jgi:hypothetical protein
VRELKHLVGDYRKMVSNVLSSSGGRMTEAFRLATRMVIMAIRRSHPSFRSFPSIDPLIALS